MRSTHAAAASQDCLKHEVSWSVSALLGLNTPHPQHDGVPVVARPLRRSVAEPIAQGFGLGGSEARLAFIDDTHPAAERDEEASRTAAEPSAVRIRVDRRMAEDPPLESPARVDLYEVESIKPASRANVRGALRQEGVSTRPPRRRISRSIRVTASCVRT